MAARSKIDNELKRQIVEKLLQGETTVADVAAEHKLHPYQVQAWVGQMTLGEGVGRKYRIAPGGSKVHSAREGVPSQGDDTGIGQLLYRQITGSDDTPPDPMHAIGEWYVRTQVLKDLPKPRTRDGK